MTDKTKKLVGFLKDDISELLYAIETNEELQDVICNVGNGQTFWEFASYWNNHLKQIEL